MALDTWPTPLRFPSDTRIGRPLLRTSSGAAPSVRRTHPYQQGPADPHRRLRLLGRQPQSPTYPLRGIGAPGPFTLGRHRCCQNGHGRSLLRHPRELLRLEMPLSSGHPGTSCLLGQLGRRPHQQRLRALRHPRSSHSHGRHRGLRLRHLLHRHGQHTRPLASVGRCHIP